MKALLVAAVVLIALFVIGLRAGFRTNGHLPREYVMELDTAAIILIEVEDRADPGNDLQLKRMGRVWERSSARPHTGDPGGQAAALLHAFRSLPVKRTMGMIRLLGERYELTDRSLCRISFTDVEHREQVLDLGRTTFAPGKNGAWTYVNIPGEKEVYAVEGLLTGLLRPGNEPLRTEAPPSEVP